MAGVIVCVTMFMASITTIIIITTTMGLSGGDDGEEIYMFALLEV
jgi:hypothetical protein